MTENTPEHEHGNETDGLLAGDCATTANRAYVTALRFVRAFEVQYPADLYPDGPPRKDAP